ncbi:uncharacterized protein LOC131642737 [Vicia villosa]|uniref:uncharacterized protein LOC131642737 n=1 Tax=Vicia villosa TaxID=3911 RepID=UPI00273B1C96|nr:uncharacterized protein LOC131642737 [Vicia villosa]
MDYPTSVTTTSLGGKSISKITSVIGNPITTDECTAKKLRISYARVLVEVDITQKSKESIWIKDHTGRRFEQKVEYEGKPKYCQQCLRMGHDCSIKPVIKKKNKDKVWQAKTVEIDEVKNKEDEHIQTTEDTWIEVSSDWRYSDRGVLTYYMIVTWNVRGMNNGSRHREIWSSLVEFKVPIVALLETRIKEHNATSIKNKFGKWNIEDNYKDHPNGRIWLFWNPNDIRLQVIHTSAQYMHMEVYGLNGGRQVVIIVVYAFNQLDRRRTLWHDLEAIGQGIQDPWIVIGDFNNVLKSIDRVGGNHVHENEYIDLTTLMQRIGLFEANTRGSYYTWTNKSTSNPIYSRIDRMIGNSDWFQRFSDAIIEVLPP